jgi:hypothetical protein
VNLRECSDVPFISLGEYAALVVAGVLNLHDALMLITTRARIVALRCMTGTTRMIAVHLGTEGVENILSSMCLPDVSIACYNGPADRVVTLVHSKISGHLKWMRLATTLFCLITVAVSPLCAFVARSEALFCCSQIHNFS